MVDWDVNFMSWSTLQLLAIYNLAQCLGIAWACICRLNTTTCRTYWRARLRYVLLLAGALAHGGQPLLFSTLPGPGGVIFAATVLAGLVLGMDRWRTAIHQDKPCT